MKTSALFLGLAMLSSVAHAVSVEFHGVVKGTHNVGCGISYNLNTRTGSVSYIVQYVGEGMSINEGEIWPERSLFGGHYTFSNANERGQLGGWYKGSLKVYGDLAAPTRFKEESSSGRFIFTGNSKVIDCIQ